ncbi:MAG: rRNA maturation RNase YbeY [bacterium]|nr:rRNA maturation RNase YbeY [bacterium]
MEFRVINETGQRLPAVQWARLFRRVQRGERAGSTTSVALVLTTPQRIGTLNRKYHHGSGSTDVLAFPAPAHQSLDGSGDIIICPAVLHQRFPRESLPALLRHRFVHALLHLHGYQHSTDRAAKRMEACTQSYLT